MERGKGSEMKSEEILEKKDNSRRRNDINELRKREKERRRNEEGERRERKVNIRKLIYQTSYKIIQPLLHYTFYILLTNLFKIL